MQIKAAAVAAILAMGGCTAPSVCEQAAEILAACTGAPLESWGECTQEVRPAADAIVELGCSAVDPDKSDALSALCVPVLRRFLPFCKLRPYTCEPDPEQIASSVCNGAEHLCEVPYDQVTHLTAHNAFSNSEDGFIRPNQAKRIYRQLAGGVRGLMLDTYDHNGTPHLCHGVCGKSSKKPLVDGLDEVRDFLECYPRDVVTILIEPHMAAELHTDPFEEAGLTKYLHVQPVGAPWPTLGEMIDSGRRLVVLSEEEDPTAPNWYHYLWDHAVETHFSARKPADFACKPNRGTVGNPLFILNHFLTIAGGDELLALVANRKSVLQPHIEDCTEAFGRPPTYVVVDFYETGSPRSLVDDLNGIE